MVVNPITTRNVSNHSPVCGGLLVSEAFSYRAVVFYLAGIANAILLLGYLPSGDG